MHRYEGDIVLNLDEVLNINPELIGVQDLVGRTISEVREVPGFGSYGRKGESFTLVFNDGSRSSILADSNLLPFAYGPLSGLVAAGVLNDDHRAKVEADMKAYEDQVAAQQRAAEIQKAANEAKAKKIQELLEHRSDLQKKLAAFGLSRRKTINLYNFIKATELELIGLGYTGA